MDLTWVSRLESEPFKSISTVGLQLWSGGFLLGDFLLHLSLLPEPLFKGEIVLEIGSGVGLIAVLCGQPIVGCRCFLATDLASHGILETLSRNVSRFVADLSLVRVLPLDLLDSDHPLLGGTKDIWDADTIRLFKNSCRYIIASDIIYKDDVTFALVSHLVHLLTPNRVLFLAMEKRVQFTLADLEEKIPARDYFLDTIEAFNVQYAETERPAPRISAELIDIQGLPQYFNYTRTPELELWKIEVVYS